MSTKIIRRTARRGNVKVTVTVKRTIKTGK